MRTFFGAAMELRNEAIALQEPWIVVNTLLVGKFARTFQCQMPVPSSLLGVNAVVR